ncbi:DEKNAAC105513 [Brettanomyces naardenensis]|uniref:DEKNAAC105513 n=1 Tax=Brettanomyces naardenensis TaxID=13370 RepID=A0A448YU19_BRENA|nr:DEKNAAC105513 [Brettanomyces naardenensis]
MDPLQAARAVAEAAAYQQQLQQPDCWPIGKQSKQDTGVDKFVLDPALQLELDNYARQEGDNKDTISISPQQQPIESQVSPSFECDDQLQENLLAYSNSVCNRCKKLFAQMGPKPFRLCGHCRNLQRQRSKRWQSRTKKKEGVCRRCGSKISPEFSKFVLCEHCRISLRTRKVKRAALGKCVHCAGPVDEDGKFKVCKRCRERDRLRRIKLEEIGACNRCARALEGEDKGYKLCGRCRSKKKVERTNSAEDAAELSKDIANEASYSEVKHSREKCGDAETAAAVALMLNEDLILPSLKNEGIKNEKDISVIHSQ